MTLLNPSFRRKFIWVLHKLFFHTPASSNILPKSTTGDDQTILTTFKTKKIYTQIPFQSNFTIKYLTESCGLSMESAIFASKKVNLNEKNQKQLDSIFSLLKSHNFSDTQIAELIEKNPLVLHCRVETNLECKIRFF